MPRLFAAAPASTVRPVVCPNCSLIIFNNCRLFSSTLTSQHPKPPWSLYALLSAFRSGVRLCGATLLLLGRLRGFWGLSRGVQFLAELVALPFGLFASALLFSHPLAQRRLGHFAAGLFGGELFPDLF